MRDEHLNSAVESLLSKLQLPRKGNAELIRKALSGYRLTVFDETRDRAAKHLEKRMEFTKSFAHLSSDPLNAKNRAFGFEEAAKVIRSMPLNQEPTEVGGKELV